MPTSYSIGNHLLFLSRGVRAARSYAAVLPREAMSAADEMETMFDEIETLNAAQEKAKQRVALLTRELKAKKRESMRVRARLIRLAEATFGPRDPRIKEFRPATVGKVRTARGPRAAGQEAPTSGEPQQVAAPSAPPVSTAAQPQEPRGTPEPSPQVHADRAASEPPPPPARPPADASSGHPPSQARPSTGGARPEVEDSGGGAGAMPPQVYVSARSLAYHRYGVSRPRQRDSSSVGSHASKGTTRRLTT
ncbi:MAG TPA: hypothetical protein VH877_10710 [Polyangia bacterium]|jgi:hypothetical protein|nr:hypothetical protein [Polyangia bacterium]